MDELKTPNQPNTEQTQAIAGKNTCGHNWYPILTPKKQKAICCDERTVAGTPRMPMTAIDPMVEPPQMDVVDQHMFFPVRLQSKILHHQLSGRLKKPSYCGEDAAG